MRIITWNLKSATETRKAWDYFLKLKPDIALLQDVMNIPENIRRIFEVKSERALNKKGGKQKFSTAILVKGKIISPLPLFSKLQWVNKELKLFEGNLVCCVAKIPGYPPLNIISVYSPAWPVDPERLEGINVSAFTDGYNEVWMTELLQDALENAKISRDTQWVVGGDYNSSETFDAAWQDAHKKRFPLRYSDNGNKETFDLMKKLGFKECLRDYNEKIIPTYKHTDKTINHQIDHLFVTNKLYSKIKGCSVGDKSVVFRKYLSDHLPIIADFKQWK